MHHTDPFVWRSTVTSSDLDIQKIVNNAAYMQHMDFTRIEHLKALGIDWEQWHALGYNLVLAHADISFKSPLKAGDNFFVTSRITRSGKIKIIFNQEVRRSTDDLLLTSAINTVVCVDIATNRPTMPKEIAEKLALQTQLSK